jgi:hypothetical protein
MSFTHVLSLLLLCATSTVCLRSPFVRPLRAAPRSLRAAVLLGEGSIDDPEASSSEGPDPDAVLMAELRKALGSMDSKELAASDERVLNNFFDDRKGTVSAFEDEFSKQLDDVQKSIESKIEDKMQSVQSDFLSRIDAAVSALRASDGSAATATSAASAAVDDDRLTEIPVGGLVVVAGGSTPLGGKLLGALVASGYRVRALVPDGKVLSGASPQVEQVAYAPFAPTLLGKSLADAAAVVLVTAAAGGAGGIEPEAVPKLVKALDTKSIRRLVMLSIHGVERTDKLPFNMQNVFGQLDKQRATEQEMILKARQMCPAVTVLRVGKLIPAPEAAPAAPASYRAEIAPGDALGGELTFDTAAAVLSQVLGRPESVNATFSLGAAPPAAAGGGISSLVGDAAFWDDQWLKLVGPEVYRRPLSALSPAETVTWLREWARLFLRPGQQLTTPVAVQDVDDGVLLRFLTRASGYADFDAEESNDVGSWAAAAKTAAGKPDGALLLVAEARPTPRVRVTRAEMEEGVLVKEMSETAVLQKLDRDIAALEAERRKGKL